MLPFSYEDRAPSSNIAIGYGATNEEPILTTGLLRGCKIKRGLAIASAGEMTFFCLLPKVQESLVLIDHSYKSLRAFCVKALLLSTIGAVETRKLLIAENRAGWDEAFAKVDDYLPLQLQKKSTTATGYGSTDALISEFSNIRREWFYADIRALNKAAKNLHRIKLIHGDLTDAIDRAPYDFFYISNALEHQGRGQKYPQVDMLTKMLTPSASILWAIAQGDSFGSNKVATDKWALKAQALGYRTTWKYRLSTLKKAA